MSAHEYLVTYDVDTSDAAGERRLRTVAKVCEGFGQRVQKSVFECRLDSGQLAMLLDRLGAVIERTNDSVRVYRLTEPRAAHVLVLGRLLVHDMRDPLVL